MSRATVPAKEKHYYIMVKFGDCYKPITKTICSSFECETGKPPKEFTKTIAEEILLGLSYNCYNAFIIETMFSTITEWFTID